MVLPLLLCSVPGYSQTGQYQYGQFLYSVGTSLVRQCDGNVCNVGVSAVRAGVEPVDYGNGVIQYRAYAEADIGFHYWEIVEYVWNEYEGGCWVLEAGFMTQVGGCSGVTGATISRRGYVDADFNTEAEAQAAADIWAADYLCGTATTIEALYGVEAINELLAVNGLSALPRGSSPPPPTCPDGGSIVSGSGSLLIEPAGMACGYDGTCGSGTPFSMISGNDMQVCCGPCQPPVEGCPSPKVWNSETCACECPVTECPEGETLDPETCDCVISPTDPNEPGTGGPFNPPPPPPPPPGDPGDPNDPSDPDPENPDPGGPDPEGPNPEDPEPPAPCSPPAGGCPEGQVFNPVTCRCEAPEDPGDCINCPDDPKDPGGPDPPNPCPPENPDCFDPNGRVCNCPTLTDRGEPVFTQGMTVEFYVAHPIWRDETGSWQYHQGVVSMKLPAMQDMRRIAFHRQGEYLDPNIVDWEVLGRWQSLAAGNYGDAPQTASTNSTGATQPAGGEGRDSEGYWWHSRRIGPLFIADGVVTVDYSGVTNETLEYGTDAEKPDAVVTGRISPYLINALSQETQKSDQRPFTFPNECGFVPYPVKGTGGGLLFGQKQESPKGAGGAFKSQPMAVQSASGKMATMANGLVNYVMANGGNATGLTKLTDAVSGFIGKWSRGYQLANPAGTDSFWIITVPVIMSSVQIDLRKGIPGAPQFQLVPQASFIWLKWLSSMLIYLWGFQRIFSFWRRNAPDVGQMWNVGARVNDAVGRAALRKTEL